MNIILNMDWPGTDEYLEQEMRELEREAHSTYPDNYENYEEDLDEDEVKKTEDEDKSEFEKYKQPSILSLEELVPSHIYFISFSYANAKDKRGQFVKIPTTVYNMRAKLLEIQEPIQFKRNVSINESSSKWELLPRDNKKLENVIVSVYNGKLLVKDGLPPKPALISQFIKSILRQEKEGYVIPSEVEKIIAKYLNDVNAEEYDEFVKQKQKQKFAIYSRKKIGGRKTKSHVRKTKRHHKKSKKTRKHFRK